MGKCYLAVEVVDVDGHIGLTVNEDFSKSISRRLSRLATLDGGAVVVDNGYSDADNTFGMKGSIKEEEATILRGIIQNYGSMLASVTGGIYRGSIQDADIASGSFQFNFLVTEKIA